MVKDQAYGNAQLHKLVQTGDTFMYLQERIQLETARLYKLAGINPLAGIAFGF